MTGPAGVEGTAGVTVKICGVTDPEAVAAVNAAGVEMVGFNFVPASVRYVTARQAAELARALAPGIARVAVVMDPDDAALDALLDAFAPDMVQLHGGETPERTAALRARTGLPVIKALAVADAGDLARAADYAEAADWLLFDAKPPKSRPGALPGGNGLAFDWALLAQNPPAGRWLLSGGLTPANVTEAVRMTRARAVDVSSGVESAPGRKDPRLIEAFAAAARAAG